jgi:hypothetical protein
MSDSNPATADLQRSPELERLRRGLQLGEFFAMSDAQMERAAELFMADNPGYMGFSAPRYHVELDRRATIRQTKKVEARAKRLEVLTKWLVGLTVVLVVLTGVLVTVELGTIGADHRDPAPLRITEIPPKTGAIGRKA